MVKPKTYNTLHLSFQRYPYTFDPQKCGDQFSSALIFLLFKGLTRLEANHDISYDLAESYQISDNSKTYIFSLGKHYWSDGSLVTAHDFVYSWKRALHPKFPVRSINFFYPIKNAKKAKQGLVSLEDVGVYAKDAHTLIVELEHPCPYFLELTSFCPLFPIPANAKENVLPICSASFRLQHFVRGEEIILEKNAYCRNSSSIQIEGIHIKIVPDEKKAFALFEKGEIDWIGDPVSPLPINHLPALLETRKIKPVARTVSCSFNTLRSPFSNLYLRKAFFYAIQHEAILKKLMLPNILASLHSLSGTLNNSFTNTFQTDVCSAKELFRKAQQELKMKHIRITLAYEARHEYTRSAQLLKANWEKVFPVSILLKPLTFKEFFGLSHHKFHMTLFYAISQHTDPINFLERLEFYDSPKNFSGWEDDKYKSLLEQYRETINPDKRLRLANLAEARLMEELPIAPIYSYHYSYLKKSYVKNLAISPIGVVQFDRVSIEKRLSIKESDEQEVLC